MRTSSYLDAHLVRADSTAQLRPLFFRSPRHPGDDWIIGHEPSDTTIALPEAGAIAIQHLQEGASVAEATEAVRQRCSEEIDVADLVVGLADLGLLACLDGQMLGEADQIGARWLNVIRPRWVSWIYSPPLLALYVIIALAGPILLVLDATIRPQAHDLLWNPSYAVDTFTLAVLGPALLVKHELGHLLAGRGRGLAAELTFGHRLFYLVAVSRVAGVWKLPRQERLVIYFAGIINDLTVAGAGALLLVAGSTSIVALPASLQALIKLVILTEYVGITWEFQVFMKTDVYHIMAELTDRHDLPERARAMLAGIVHHVSHRLPPQNRTVSPGREALLDGYDWLDILYTLLSVIGIGGSMVWFVFYLLPAGIIAIGSESARLLIGVHSYQTRIVLDSAIALATQGIFCSLLVWSWLRTVWAHKYARSRRINANVR